MIYDLNYKSLNLLLPHKEMNSRNFVLFPLKEIQPNWIHPKTNETVDTLIEKLPPQVRKSILILADGTRVIIGTARNFVTTLWTAVRIRRTNNTYLSIKYVKTAKPSPDQFLYSTRRARNIIRSDII